MEAAGFSETLVPIYRNAWLCITEDNILIFPTVRTQISHIIIPLVSIKDRKFLDQLIKY
jgi:hypothetical protein